MLSNNVCKKLLWMNFGSIKNSVQKFMKGLGWKNAWKRSGYLEWNFVDFSLQPSLILALCFWQSSGCKIKGRERKAEGTEAFSCIQSRKAMAEKPSWKSFYRVLKSPALKSDLRRAFLFVFDLFGKNKNCNENCKEEKNFSALLSSKMSKTFKLVFLRLSSVWCLWYTHYVMD